MTYAASRLYEEVAYVAYHFHWDLDRILDLEHPLRQRFVDRDRRDQPADHGRGLTGGGVVALRASAEGRARDHRRSASREGHAGPSVVEPTAVSNAWRDLPPLRPSAPPIELTAPVQRLADTMTSKHHTGVTGDELGHVGAVDGPAGTVAGLLKPTRRDAPRAHRSRVADLRRGSARADRRARRRCRSRGAQRQAIAPTERLVPPPVEAAAPVELIAPDRSPANHPGRACRTSGSRPLAPAGAVAWVRTDADHADRIADRRRTTRAGPRVATSPAVPPDVTATAPGRRRGPPVASASAGRSFRRRRPIGSEAPRHTQRAPLVGTHPHRAAHRASRLRERPASMVPTAEFSRRWHDAASAGDPCRHRSTPGRRARRAPAGAARPGVVPARVARPVASIDVAVERSRDASVTPPPPGRCRRRPLVGSRPSIQRLAEQRRPAHRAPHPTRRRGRPGDRPRRRYPSAGGRSPNAGCNEHQRACPPTCGPSSSRCSARRSTTSRSTATPTRGAAARQLSAKAFTAGGEVFLPDWHGIDEHGRGAHDPHPRTDPRRPATAARRVAAGRGVTGGCRTRVGSAIGRPARSSRADAAGRAEPVAPAAQRLPGEPPSRSLRRRHNIEPAFVGRASSGMSPMDVVGQGAGRSQCGRDRRASADCRRAMTRPPGRRHGAGHASPSRTRSSGHRSAEHRATATRRAVTATPVATTIDVVDTDTTKPALRPTIRRSSTNSPGVCIHVSAPVSARTCSPTASARAGSSTSDDVKGDRRWRTQPSRTASR